MSTENEKKDDMPEKINVRLDENNVSIPDIKDEKEHAAILNEVISEDTSKERGKDNKSGFRIDLAMIAIVAAMAIIAVSVVLIVGHYHNSQTAVANDTFQYGNFTFIRTGALYHTEYQLGNQLSTIDFHYLPQQVLNITSYGMLKPYKSPIYLSIQPDMNGSDNAYLALAVADLSRKLKGIYGQIPEAACTYQDNNFCTNLSVVTCESNQSAVVFYESNQTGIMFKGQCAEIYGNGENIYRAETKLVYLLLGIIKPNQ